MQRPTRSAAAADDHATLDYWDDPIDVYAIKLTKGETVFARLDLGRVPNWLTLWQPGTMHVTGPARIELSEPCGARERPSAGRSGWLSRPGQRHLLPRGAGRRRHARRRRLPARDRGRSRTAAAARLGQKLFVGHVAQHPRGVADDERPRRDVLRHDGAGADERLLADLDRRAEHRAGADARAAADRRPLDQLAPRARCGP